MRQAAQAVAPAWKEEVNRRIAEHKGRKAGASEAQPQLDLQLTPGTPAAKAAARVAARYAKAPSYSQMLAEEARAAVRAAEAASKAALQAQAVAQSVLDNLEAAQCPQLELAVSAPLSGNWDQEFFTPTDTPAETPQTPWPQSVLSDALQPSHLGAWETSEAAPTPTLSGSTVSAPATSAPATSGPATSGPDTYAPATSAPTQKRARKQATRQPAQPAQPFEIRWDADLPTREAPAYTAPASAGRDDFFTAPQPSRWDDVHAHSAAEAHGFEMVEPAQPIHANLIEFPRELVATRKLRPRRAEGPYAAQIEADAGGERQLSIFEVEPFTISTEPDPVGSVLESSSTWVGPDWSSIELDAEPAVEIFAPAPNPISAAISVPAQPRASSYTPSYTASYAEQTAQPAPAADDFSLVAPLGRRLLAGLVDFSLIAAAFLAAALVASLNVAALPAIKQMEMDSALGLGLTVALYLGLFFTLGKATPGMMYASLEVCAFSGQKATRLQRLQRSGSMLLSLLPLGVGAALALFDEQHLCWHDRLSGTYVRQS